MVIDDETYQAFKGSLLDSEDARWAGARWLSKRGYIVTLDPLFVVQPGEENADYLDNGDIWIKKDPRSTSPGPQYGRIEVKQALAQKPDWTTRETWRWKRVLVCDKETYDRADPKPTAYMIYNRPLTHLVMIMTDTYDSWEVDLGGDGRKHRGKKKLKYYCPMDKVTFLKG